MSRIAVKSSRAPAALGPYSQAIKTGNFLFCSGQVGLDPQTMELVAGGVEEQARQVMLNLSAVLLAGGSSFDRVLKTTIFLANIGDFAAVNAIYGQAFAGDPPARSTVQVAALPKGALVEIEVIALCE